MGFTLGLFDWRWCHLEGTSLCFGHSFEQFLADFLPTINFFGGSRVSGFLLVFPAFYGFVTAACFRIQHDFLPHNGWIASNWILNCPPARENFASELFLLSSCCCDTVILCHFPCAYHLAPMYALKFCHVSHFTLTNWISSNVPCVFSQPQGLGRHLRVRPHIDGSWGLRSEKKKGCQSPYCLGVSQDTIFQHMKISAGTP